MDSHKRVLGILYLISGTLLLVTMFFLSLFLSTIFTFAMKEVDPDEAVILELVSSFVRYIPAIFIILFSIPSIIAGIGLLGRQKWAMILALILGCFKLFSFPIGTALGVYTIWVYSEDQKLEKAARQG
jgi:hypothetical protein